MTALRLDRMALDDEGLNPRKLAEAIHRQLGDLPGPVPVHEIALALDILEIREEPLENIEGALVTQVHRDRGSILVNENSSRQRRRFSIGHELLHFLNPTHHPVADGEFACSTSDMRDWDLNNIDTHLRQEAEANCFSIELLAPAKKIRPFVKEPPDLGRAFAMADNPRPQPGGLHASLRRVP